VVPPDGFEPPTR